MTASADLKAYLAAAVPPGPWLFPEDQLTDASLRQSAAEITREKLFLRLHDELPYQLPSRPPTGRSLTTADQDRADDLCERESQRKIVLGAKGQTIKEIGKAAPRRHRRDGRACRCISSCSSRCANTGPTTPSAIARWGSIIPRAAEPAG